MEKRFTCDAAFKGKVILCADKISNHAAGRKYTADKISNHAAGRKYTVSEACVRHWRSIKTKLFSYLTKRKSLSRPRKGRKPEIDISGLEYSEDLKIKDSL
jgi:hypothetical protein